MRIEQQHPAFIPKDHSSRMSRQTVTAIGRRQNQIPFFDGRVGYRRQPFHHKIADVRADALVRQDEFQVGQIAAAIEIALLRKDLTHLRAPEQRLLRLE